MEKRFQAPKPVAVGDEKDVSIESTGGHGDGIAKIDDFVVFVKGAQKGENCRIRITDVKRTFALAEKLGAAKGKKEEVQEMDDETEGQTRGGPSG
ncbi:MAG: TRAM domain-containing protein [Candidatus Micrarchaeia archaeon]